MSDIVAARARHVGEHKCVGPWDDPDTIYINDCDASLFRDALDKMTTRCGKAQEEWIDARALADELAEALRRRHNRVPDTGCDACAALAKWEASK